MALIFPGRIHPDRHFFLYSIHFVLSAIRHSQRHETQSKKKKIMYLFRVYAGNPRKFDFFRQNLNCQLPVGKIREKGNARGGHTVKSQKDKEHQSANQRQQQQQVCQSVSRWHFFFVFASVKGMEKRRKCPVWLLH